MTHLTPDQLQARLDDALDRRALEEADRHLEACAQCREALASLVAGDEALRDALTHEPGEAYFERFAARVEDRLRAEGLRGAQSRLGGDDRWFAWLRSPQRLAWIGGMAVVVAGAAIVLMTSREQRMPTPVRDARIADRIDAVEPSPAAPSTQAPLAEAPAAGQAGPETSAPGTPAYRKADEPPAAAKAPAESKEFAADRAIPAAERDRPSATAPAPAPARLQATTRNATGRDVAARDERFATPPAPAAEAQAPRAEGEGVRVRRDRAATPMQKSATEPVAEPLVAGEKLEGGAGAAGACGIVTDATGRALANAVVVHVASGKSATTDAKGVFCLPEGIAGEVAVMAVGYAPNRLAIGAEPLAASLTPVPVLEGGITTRAMDADGSRSLVTAKRAATSALSAPAGAADPFAGAGAAAQALIRTARGATSFANATGSPAAWEAAAAAWSRVVPAVSGTAVNEARAQLAEARYRAWKVAPTVARADAARRSLAEFALGAPAGAAREQAVNWMTEVGK